MILLYLAEFYSITAFITGLFVNVMPLSRERAAKLNTSELPFVDILIPTYNEALNVVRITSIGASLIDYPKNKFAIHILDDGSTDEKINSLNPQVRNNARIRRKIFKNFCDEYGLFYRTRKDNSHAKAGNLNAALPHCKGDLLLVLDCDHVPTRDILKRLVGFFQRDPKLFLVQTPHFMINANPVEKNLGLFADAPSENEMFYGYIQKGLDFWNSSFFCGSAALLRKKFLLKVGGFLGETITEDAETSLALHSKGLKSLYFEYPVTSGLSPESFIDFITQRSRWAQGMMQILLLKNPLFKKGLKLYQKISYTNLSAFWLFGLVRTVFLIAPLLYLFFGLRIYMASVPDVIAYAFPFLISSFFISNFLFGRFRWPLFSELYETALSLFLVPAIIQVFLNPKRPHFKVTPKGQSLVKDFFSPMGWLFVGLLIICLLALFFAYYRWITFPLDRDVVIICTSFVIFHLILLTMCLGSVYERHQLRKYPRTWATGKINLSFEGTEGKLVGDITDLSLGGMAAQIKTINNYLRPGKEVVIKTKDSYGNNFSFKAKIIRITKNKSLNHFKVAFQFKIKNPKDIENIIAYVYGDSKRWELYQARKRKSMPVLRGVIYLIRQGLSASKLAMREITSIAKEKVVQVIVKPKSIVV